MVNGSWAPLRMYLMVPFGICFPTHSFLSTLVNSLESVTSHDMMTIDPLEPKYISVSLAEAAPFCEGTQLICNKRF